MPTPNQIRDQINERIGRLVTVGLADDQLLAFRRQHGNRVEITFPNAEHVSSALKNIAYEDSYRILARERAFNIKMLDGALIQMMYEFRTAVSNDTAWRSFRPRIWTSSRTVQTCTSTTRSTAMASPEAWCRSRCVTTTTDAMAVTRNWRIRNPT